MKTIKTAILLVTVLSLALVWAQDAPTPGTSLHLAALLGDLAAVQQHIEAGTNLDQKDDFG